MTKWGANFKSPPPRIEVLFNGTAVAVLTRRKDDKYAFSYLPSFGELKLAPLPGFQRIEPDREYVSPDLFPFFAERIPELRRPEVQEWLRRHHVDPKDEMGLLAELGKKSVTNSYELRRVA